MEEHKTGILCKKYGGSDVFLSHFFQKIQKIEKMKVNKNLLKKVKMLLHLIKNNFETIDFAYVFIFLLKCLILIIVPIR